MCAAIWSRAGGKSAEVSLNQGLSPTEDLFFDMRTILFFPLHVAHSCPRIYPVLILSFGFLFSYGKSDASMVRQFSTSVTKLEQMEQRYRAVGMIDDFSKIVGKMIESLKKVEAKGQDMVEKINVQEEKLGKLTRQVELEEAQMRNFEEKKKSVEGLVQKARVEMERVEARKVKLEMEVSRLEVKRGKMSREVKSLGEVVDSKREDKEEALARMEEELGGVRNQIETAQVELR